MSNICAGANVRQNIPAAATTLSFGAETEICVETPVRVNLAQSTPTAGGGPSPSRLRPDQRIPE